MFVGPFVVVRCPVFVVIALLMLKPIDVLVYFLARFIASHRWLVHNGCECLGNMVALHSHKSSFETEKTLSMNCQKQRTKQKQDKTTNAYVYVDARFSLLTYC